MAFLETPRFPDTIAYNSKGGPSFFTSIATTQTGKEKRNIEWTTARHVYNISNGLRTVSDLEEIKDFFHVMRGQANGFRFKDWLDYKSCAVGDTISDTDNIIGAGTGSEVDFQLKKVYIKGSLSESRDITKPVSGTVVVALDAVSQPSGWSVDTTTGIVTFSVAPGSGVVVSAGFEFDVPVRFATDKFQGTIANFDTGTTSVNLIEIFD